MGDNENVEDLSRIYFSKTEREWKWIEKRMIEISRKDLSGYVAGRINLLEKQYSENPRNIMSNMPKTKRRYIKLNESSLRIIGVLSLKSGMPVATIIDKMILDPLMMPLD